MEAIIPDFRIHRCIRVIWQRDVDKCTFIVLCSWSSCRDWGGMFFGNTLRIAVMDEVASCRQHVCLLLSHHTEMNCFLLKCLIGQLRRNVIVVVIIVDNHSVDLCHSFMIYLRRDCGGHCCVPRNVWST